MPSVNKVLTFEHSVRDAKEHALRCQPRVAVEFFSTTPPTSWRLEGIFKGGSSSMPKQIAGKTYLTTPEAAKHVGISRWTLHRWLATRSRRNGAVKILRDRVSGRTYIAQESLRELQRHRFQPTSLGL